jgi:endonuclease/exonuclease/phosphatase (EEP) superfamily protein YafD
MILRFARRASAVLTATLLAAVIASLLPWQIWALEILASFRVPLITLCFGSGLFALFVRLRAWAVFGFALASIQVLLSIPLFVAAGSNGHAPDARARLRVLSMNVEWCNREGDAVLSLIRSLEPDIVALQEIDYWWRRELETLRAEFPFQTFDRLSARPGVGVLARRAPVSEEWDDLHGRAFVALRFGEGENSIGFASAHAFPPKSPRLYRLRNHQIDRLAERLAAFETPLVLAGDLNATPWSPVLGAFERRTGLASARAGRGTLPTWPTWSRLFSFPIDHIHHSDAFLVEELRRVPIPGSDHFGLFAVLSLRETRG